MNHHLYAITYGPISFYNYFCEMNLLFLKRNSNYFLKFMIDNLIYKETNHIPKRTEHKFFFVKN